MVITIFIGGQGPSAKYFVPHVVNWVTKSEPKIYSSDDMKRVYLEQEPKSAVGQLSSSSYVTLFQYFTDNIHHSALPFEDALI